MSKLSSWLEPCAAPDAGRGAARTPSTSLRSLRTRGLRVIAGAILAASLCGALLAPSAVEAQARQPKQRVRITAADRKAAAEARKAKMEAWKKAGGAKGAAARGGAR